MKPYQERVVEEKKELDLRIEKLITFLESDAFKQLPEPEQKRLARQEHVMVQYSDVLTERIQNFT